jgi:hypothetical protein
MFGGDLSSGTRFRLYPQAPFLHPDRQPETVSIASPPGTIGPGPSDNRLFVIAPLGKANPYGVAPGPAGTPYLSLPPWRGPIRNPAYPSADGHFDQIPVDAPEFAQAHLFGAIRFVLQIWENYLSGRIDWHFARHFERLEALIFPSLDNARAGYGYMEAGAHPNDDGTVAEYALNFDVIAHEIGHLIIYSLLGVPRGEAEQEDYFGFQEAAADITAMIASLHFRTMSEQLLEDTHGNLYTFNELNRFAELSTNSQIRVASNSVKLSRFAAGWDDEHDLSEPLTGALFDTMVDIFQEKLVERGAISRVIADLSDDVREHPEYEPFIQAAFDQAYAMEKDVFRQALAETRDYLGVALAETWKGLSGQFLSYDDVARVLLAVDGALSGGRYRQEILESFDWREIGRVRVGPRLRPPDESSHARSVRTLVPEVQNRLPKMTYYERALLAGLKIEPAIYEGGRHA